jgi:hypothetical protein
MSSPARDGHRRDDAETVSPSGTGVARPSKEPHVVVGDEHVHEAAQPALVVEDALGEARVLRPRAQVSTSPTVAPSTADLGLAPGEGAQGGGHADGDAHRRGPGRLESGSAITGPGRRRSGEGGFTAGGDGFTNAHPASPHARPVPEDCAGKPGQQLRTRRRHRLILAPCVGCSGPSTTRSSMCRRLAELEGAAGTTACRCACRLATRQATVGPIVDRSLRELVRATGLVDEVLVVDDHSSGRHRRGRSRAAGLDGGVACRRQVLPDLGPGAGKGEALWKSVAARGGDLIVWVDADIVDFGPRLRGRAGGPAPQRPDVDFVKGHYDRPLDGAEWAAAGSPSCVARPLRVAAVPRPRLHRPAARRRVRRSAVAARAAALRAGLRGRRRPAHRHRRPGGHRGASPRSTSASAATATGRSTSSAPRRWP